jgi:hypothetical protein
MADAQDLKIRVEPLRRVSHRIRDKANITDFIEQYALFRCQWQRFNSRPIL